MASAVHIVDDDPVARWMIGELLQGVADAIRAHATAEEFFDAYRPADSECLVIDLRMPGMDGLQAQQVMKARGIFMPILFVSAQAGVGEAVTAMREGADDFLEKPLDALLLQAKVMQALNRSRELVQARRQREHRDEQLSQLTQREREVAELVSLGLSSREVAEQLGLSARTVENHRARAMEKLGAASAVELALWMMPGPSRGA